MATTTSRLHTLSMKSVLGWVMPCGKHRAQREEKLINGCPSLPSFVREFLNASMERRSSSGSTLIDHHGNSPTCPTGSSLLPVSIFGSFPSALWEDVPCKQFSSWFLSKTLLSGDPKLILLVPKVVLKTHPQDRFWNQIISFCCVNQ
jgi:hypothetical protein